MANIVIFAPKFMGYDKKIKAKLIEDGNSVYLFDQRSVKSGIGKAISKKAPFLLRRKNIKYYKAALDQVLFVPDKILVIQADLLERPSMDYIKKRWPSVKTILYLWDNLSNLKGVKKKVAWFDKAYTFDPIDAQNIKGLDFKPLFFSDDFRYVPRMDEKPHYDLCSIGTIHSDRYTIISEIAEIAETKEINFYQFNYLPAKWLYLFYKLLKKSFKKAHIDEFSFEKKALNEISKVQKDSKVILDINHPKQRGLTMRTIEIMALGRKMITTNQDIINYDFYNSKNIFIIQRERIMLPEKEFFESEPVLIPEKVRNKYSLNQWLKDVLNI